MGTILGLTMILSLFSVVMYNNPSENSLTVDFRGKTFRTTNGYTWSLYLVEDEPVTFLHNPEVVINATRALGIEKNIAKDFYSNQILNIGVNDRFLSVDYFPEFLKYLGIIGFQVDVGCYNSNCTLISKTFNSSEISYAFRINSSEFSYDKLENGYDFSLGSYDNSVLVMEKIMLDFLGE